jgi:hypothetical protein
MDIDGPSQVSLRGPNDWKQWISIIEKFSINQGIWTYLDPNKPDKPALCCPTEPQPSDINLRAADIITLTDIEFKKLEFLTARYRTQLQTYRNNQKAIYSIQEYIIKTIGSYYDTIATENSVARQLELLQARLRPTSWELEKEVLARYKLVLKAPNRTKIEAWITSWQKVFTEAQQLRLPDTEGLRPTLDFLDSVAQISPTFANYWINRINDKANSNKEGWQQKIPNGIKISDLFEQHYYSQKLATSNEDIAGFATFQQESQSENQSASQLASQPASQSASQSTSQEENQTPKCICNEWHFFYQCPYLIEQLREPNWKPNQAIEARVQEKLQKPFLQRRIDEIRQKALNDLALRGQEIQGTA